MTKKNHEVTVTDEQIRKANEYIAWRNAYEMPGQYRPFGMTLSERLKGEAEAAIKKGDHHGFYRAFDSLKALARFA